jgi:hypothetical protein
VDTTHSSGEPTATAALRDSRSWSLIADLLAVAAGVWAASCALDGTFMYNVFTDRDLARSDGFPWHIELSGAEMTGEEGARLPGSALSVLMGAGTAWAHDPVGAFQVMIAVWLAGVAVLHVVLRRTLGARVALIATLVQLVHPASIQTLDILWNPSFMIGFAAAGTAALVFAVHRDDERALVGWAAALGVGAQLHLTSGAWLLATLPGALWARLTRAGRGFAGAAAALIAVYLPYLVHEAATGGVLVRRLFGHAGRTAAGQIVERSDTSDLGPRLLGYVLGAPQGNLGRILEAAPADVALVAVVTTLMGVGLVIGWRRSTPAGRAVHPLAVGLTLELAAWWMGVFHQVEVRYAVVLVPATAVLMAVAADRLAAALPRWPAWALTAALLGLLGARASGLPNGWSLRGSPFAWSNLDESLTRLQDATGWTLREVAGRTAWRRIERDGEPEAWSPWPAVDFLLHRQGEAFPGSLPPPCAIVLGGRRASEQVSAADIARALYLDAPPTEVGPTVPLTGDWRLATYVPVSGRCATTMSQRYVDTSAEAAARTLWRSAPPNTPVALPLDDGQRLAVMLSGQPDGARRPYGMLLVVDLVPRGGVVEARLESNQLRGYADNDGYTEPWMLRAPTIVLSRDDGASVEIPLSTGRVGQFYELPPLAASAAVAAGSWRATFTATVIDVDQREPLRVHYEAPVRLDLTERLVVP